MTKTRSGFVSNSSSSSFIIAAKGELTKDAVLKALGVPEKSPLFSFADDIADVLMRAKPMKQLDLEDWGDDGTLAKLIKKGMTIYEGDASDDDYRSAEAMLCNMTLHYNSPTLVIIHEAGS